MKNVKEGAKWDDENLDSTNIYTKQELRDMGFAFDLNGNIRTLEECYESSVQYLEYRKREFIDKACEWLKRHLYDYDYVEGFEVFRNVESFTKDFRKAMEK